MKVNKRQIWMVSIAIASLIVIIARVCMPDWGPEKAIEFIPAILVFLSMALLFIAEEKRKK